MRIHCDGIFDRFHRGHLKHLQTLANIEPNVTLYVGSIIGYVINGRSGDKGESYAYNIFGK